MDIDRAREIAPTFFAIIDAAAHIQKELEQRNCASGVRIAVSEATFALLIRQMANVDSVILKAYTPGIISRAEGSLREIPILGNCQIFCRSRETHVYDFRDNLKGKKNV